MKRPLPGGNGGAVPLSAYRLPPGRHGLPRELVAENQRWRLLGAITEGLAQRGWAAITARDVATGAGVSSNTFYKYFDDISACLLAAHEVAVDCIWGVVSSACETRSDRPAGPRAAIEAVLSFWASEPALAQLLGAETLAVVEAIAPERERLIARLGSLLRQSAPLGSIASASPPVFAEHLTAAAIALLADRVRAGDADQLPNLGPELAQLLLMPGGPTDTERPASDTGKGARRIGGSALHV